MLFGGKNVACFLVPMALAVITSTIQRTARGLSEKLKIWILNVLLWGGVILLALEHVWHGEVVPWPPFLTAMLNPADISLMLYEMATIGTTMTAVTVAAWGIILAVNHLMLKMGVAKITEPLKKPFITAKP
ncbi:hypothetical protein KEJ31_04385 [Candidatus Bathyarchaeota archaeon]|nr:hypothetical protein [Candidatus Bathyarchaeota archaeon]